MSDTHRSPSPSRGGPPGSLTPAVDAAGLVLWHWDRSTGRLSLHGAVRSVLGVDPGPVTTWPWLLGHVHAHDRAALRALQRSLLVGTPGIVQGEYRFRPPGGATRRVLLRGGAVGGPGGRLEAVAGVALDVTDLRSPSGCLVPVAPTTAEQVLGMEREREELLARSVQARAELVQLATTDPLTGLANRAALSAALREHLGAGRQLLALLFLDLDRFKLINDTLGHVVGDGVLVAIARRLRAGVLPHHPVARFGGDEFAVAVPGADESRAVAHARRLLQAIARPMLVGEHELVVAASVGVAVAEPGEDPVTLLAWADAALHEAKRRGRDRVEVFTQHLRDELREKLTVESGIRRAVDTDGLDLDWQPVWELTGGTVTGVEALVRWEHPARGRLPAGAFVPVAEETDLIVRLGAWVRRAAFRRAAAWAGTDRWPGIVWVNASAREVVRRGWARGVLADLDAAGLDPAALGVEVTETAIMTEPDIALAELGMLRAEGVALAVDDFGTGHSSLAYLWQFAPDVIKIDRRFVSGVDRDVDARAIIEAVVSMARSFGVVTVAEGVEHERQLLALTEVGCDQASGHLLARPVPAPALDLRTPAVLSDHVGRARRRVRTELLPLAATDGSQRNRRAAMTAASAPQAPSAAR